MHAHSLLAFPRSLASNNLVVETDYVNKSKVQGSSFEVGAKVTYEGREMMVSKVPDSDGELKMIDLSGFMALAACVSPRVRQTDLFGVRLRCRRRVFAFLSSPHDTLLSHHPRTAVCSQSRGQLDQSRGRLHARRHPQRDKDHQPEVRRSPESDQYLPKWILANAP